MHKVKNHGEPENFQKIRGKVISCLVKGSFFV